MAIRRASRSLTSDRVTTPCRGLNSKATTNKNPAATAIVPDVLALASASDSKPSGGKMSGGATIAATCPSRAVSTLSKRPIAIIGARRLVNR